MLGLSDPVLELDFNDGELAILTSLADFCGANSEECETCAHVRSLAIGEAFDVGGGAAPLVTITRLS